MPKNSQGKKRKKTVFLRGVLFVATTNRKCLFASIFLNVNCEKGEVKRDKRSLRLSESHPQSYCSLAKNDAKHSLKPILFMYSYDPRGIKLAPHPTPPRDGYACVVTVFVSVCCVLKGYKRKRSKKLIETSSSLFGNLF